MRGNIEHSEETTLQFIVRGRAENGSIQAYTHHIFHVSTQGCLLESTITLYIYAYYLNLVAVWICHDMSKALSSGYETIIHILFDTNSIS